MNPQTDTFIRGLKPVGGEKQGERVVDPVAAPGEERDAVAVSEPALSLKRSRTEEVLGLREECSGAGIQEAEGLRLTENGQHLPSDTVVDHTAGAVEGWRDSAAVGLYGDDLSPGVDVDYPPASAGKDDPLTGR